MKNEIKRLVTVQANEDLTLDLDFGEGEVRRFDAKPYLDKGIFTELKDIQYFKNVRVAFGTVQWKNEQDFAPETLFIESEVIG